MPETRTGVFRKNSLGYPTVCNDYFPSKKRRGPFTQRPFNIVSCNPISCNCLKTTFFIKRNPKGLCLLLIAGVTGSLPPSTRSANLSCEGQSLSAYPASIRAFNVFVLPSVVTPLPGYLSMPRKQPCSQSHERYSISVVSFE